MSNFAPRPHPPRTQIPDYLNAVAPGWHPLLLRLHEQLLAIQPEYRVDDLKEKFGSLRIHVSDPALDDQLFDTTWHARTGPLIDAAEEESERTCEFCGQPGRRRSRGDRPGGWFKSVCDRCHTQRSICPPRGPHLM